MDAIEKRILEIIDKNSGKIRDFGRDIFTHAELGYKEHRTAGKFAAALQQLGIETEQGLAITGVKGYLNPKGAAGVNLAVMGELDALPISGAAHTNPETGAAHCCGHNAQLTGVYGAAIALADPTVRVALGGNPIFVAAPAEECVDLEYKEALAKEGKIRYFGGKCELIRIGALDEMDMVLGHHSDTSRYPAAINNGASNGFVSKTVRFTGLAAHAAGAPHQGVDALEAASVAMHAIDVQRETFREADHVRVHGFISKGGEAANVIADEVTMQFLVRASGIDAIRSASRKVDRALKAGAVATGCGLEISTTPGYLPTVPLQDVSLLDALLAEMVPADQRDPDDLAPSHGPASTDYGDVSYLFPLMQFATSGFAGHGHNPDYHVTDEEVAYVLTAKIFALAAYRLLKEDAAALKAIQAGYTPQMDKAAYIEYMESMLETQHIPMEPIL